MKKKIFITDELDLVFITPAPIDMSEGLVLSDSYIEVAKVEKNRVNAKVGIGGEVLLSDVFHPVHTLTITYLPNADAVLTLEALLIAKTQFGVFLTNNTVPKYKGIATECRIVNAPDTSAGKNGFKNLEYKIIMSDYLGLYMTGLKI